MKSLKQQRKITGLLFVTPSVVILIFVALIPLIFSLITSFFHFTLVDPNFNEFVSFKNFAAIIKDNYLWNSLKVTLMFVFTVIVVEFILGFFIAILLNQNFRFKGIFYTILTIPMVISPISVGLLWKMFLHPELGIVNYMFSVLHLPYVNWFVSTKAAFAAIVLVDIWHQVSFMILILLAGLKGLPIEPYESAKIDGANDLQRFFYITLPLMKPIIFVAILIRLVFSFRTFDLIYMMTKGGPGISTDVVSYYIYRIMFMGMDMSTASSISYMLLIIIIIIVIFLYRQMGRQK